MSVWPPRVDYNLAVLRVCKQLQIEYFSREQIAQNSTGFTFSVECCYRGHRLQAFGTSSNEKIARMDASRKCLILIVQRARGIGDPALCIEECGLIEKDLCSWTGRQAENWIAKAINKSNPAIEIKPEEVLKAKPVSSANQSISNSSSSSTSPQPVEFDYLAAVDRLKPTGSICTFKELTVQGIGETKFTFLLEVNHNGDKFQAFGSAASKKNAEKDACKNILIQMKLRNPALTLDECGLTKQDLTDYNTGLLNLQAKLRDITNGPVDSTISSTTSQSAQAKHGAVLTNTCNANQSLDNCSISSTTSQSAKFNQLTVVKQLKQTGVSFTFKELTDQSSIVGLETKFIFVLQINHQGIEVYAFGSGPSKTKARAEACKAALIKLVHRLKLGNPGLSLESYGVTESELTEYERCCTDTQANDSIAKAVLSLLTEKVPIDLTPCSSKDVSDYAKSIDEQADNSSAKAIEKTDDWVTFTKQGVGVKKSTCNPTPSLLPTPSKPVKFNYFDVMKRFSRFTHANSNYSFSELTDQNDAGSRETKFVFKLHINHRGIKVNGFGSGTTKLQARTEACRKTLIKLVHRLKLINPTIALDLASYGVNESELAEYEKGLTGKQANDRLAKTVLSPPTRTAKTPAHSKTDSTTEKLLDQQAGLFVKPPPFFQVPASKEFSLESNRSKIDGQAKRSNSENSAAKEEAKPDAEAPSAVKFLSRMHQSAKNPVSYLRSCWRKMCRK